MNTFHIADWVSQHEMAVRWRTNLGLVLLSSCAMFNHGNIRLPARADRVLRWFMVTPDMHRVHHSVEDDESNCNFGFNLTWWDRLLGTCREQPRTGLHRMPQHPYLLIFQCPFTESSSC